VVQAEDDVVAHAERDPTASHESEAVLRRGLCHSGCSDQARASSGAVDAALARGSPVPGDDGRAASDPRVGPRVPKSSDESAEVLVGRHNEARRCHAVPAAHGHHEFNDCLAVAAV
jgi:hypothetical protein